MTGKANTGRRRILVAAFVVAALTAGALLRGMTRDTSNEGPDPAVADSPARSEPADGSRTESGTSPASFAHSEAGATDAAIAYAWASQGWLYLSDEGIRRAVAAVATPEAANRLAEDVVADVSAARARLASSPGRVWWLVRPLGWDVERYTAAEARVSVWTVTVLSAAGVAAPQTEWMTVSIDLAWERDGWRVDAVRSTPGPTPMTGPNDQPWDAEPFDHALDGFTRIGEEPAR